MSSVKYIAGIATNRVAVAEIEIVKETPTQYHIGKVRQLVGWFHVDKKIAKGSDVFDTLPEAVQFANEQIEKAKKNETHYYQVALADLDTQMVKLAELVTV